MVKSQDIKDFKKKEKELDSKYASKDDINRLTEAIIQIAKNVNELTEKQANPIIVRTESGIAGTADLSKVKESTPPVKTAEQFRADEDAAPMKDKMPIPPAWRKDVDEILGMDFGIDVVYPQSGKGFLFKVIIPEEKSNMSKDFKEFYKVDIRTKAINYNEGVDGIRKFCEGIKKNLERKQTQT